MGKRQTGRGTPGDGLLRQQGAEYAHPEGHLGSKDTTEGLADLRRLS